MYEALQLGLPLIAILAGILLNRQDIAALRSELLAEIGSVRGEIGGLRGEFHSEIGGLRGELHSEIGGLRSEMNSRFDSIQRDLREFYAEQARHDVRISKLERPE